MARQLRILYAGAWYHVMNRGVNKQTIFFKTKHREEFIALLEHVSKVYNVEIHAYCLMTNHYHILIRTREANLPEVMQYLNSVYARKVNIDMCRDGPLLRGRFKSVLIADDEHLLCVSRYIHLNPLEAGLIDQMDDSQWSSYPYYIGNQKKPAWLKMDFIQKYFSDDHFFEEYKNFVGQGNDDDIKKFYTQKRLNPVYASKKFIQNLKLPKPKCKEISDFNIFRKDVSLLTIIKVVAEVTAKHQGEITRSTRGKTNDFRNIFIYISREYYGFKLHEIGCFLSNTHYFCISASFLRFEKKLQRLPELRSIIAICRMKLEHIIRTYS